jgi:hypothetical protein
MEPNTSIESVDRAAIAKWYSGIEAGVNVIGVMPSHRMSGEPDCNVEHTNPVYHEETPPAQARGILHRKAMRETRNREAAARSNAKRKACLRALSDDLEQAHDKVRALQTKEAEARAGNAVLKEEAVKVWRKQIESGRHP